MREVIQAAMEGQMRGVRVEHVMSAMRFCAMVVLVGGEKIVWTLRWPGS